MTNKNLVDSRLRARGYLIDVIRCVIYLARQGIALQGSVNNDNFTQLMLLLGTQDATIKSKLLSDGKKYSHRDVQNELLSIMSKHVLIKKVDIIRKNGFFAIMCDEYTDVNNKEQLSFCIRTVNEQLIVDEAFLGYYEIANIKSETIVNASKDILLRFGLERPDIRWCQQYAGKEHWRWNTMVPAICWERTLALEHEFCLCNRKNW